MQRRALVASVLLAAFAGPSVWVMNPATAQSTAGGDDYFVRAFGDPMDFSNPEDAITNTNDGMFNGAESKSISGGQLHVDSAHGFRFDPVWAGYPSSLPLGREGRRNPIDVREYRRVIARVNAPEDTTVVLRWYYCVEKNSCFVDRPYSVRAGWQTLDMNFGFSQGVFVGFSFLGGPGHWDIDYMRLVGADTVDIGEMTGAAPLPEFPSNETDYAFRLGNAWDYDRPSDVRIDNVTRGSSFVRGQTRACTIGTASGKSTLLRYAVDKRIPIDASVYKTLSFTYSLDGEFNSRPRPGGGTYARVFWWDAKGQRHPTKSIMLYPNVALAQFRLDDPETIFDGRERGHGESGAKWEGTVTAFAINPVDDKSSRCFTIGRVWLSADPISRS